MVKGREDMAYGPVYVTYWNHIDKNKDPENAASHEVVIAGVVQ